MAGRVQWLDLPGASAKDRKGKDWRIVHAHGAAPKPGSCQRDPNRPPAGTTSIGDCPLTELLGPDGLMLLEGYVSDGRLPEGERAELLKRLLVPGYDLARGYISQAIGDGVIEPNGAPGCLTQAEIRAVIEYAQEDGELEDVTPPPLDTSE